MAALVTSITWLPASRRLAICPVSARSLFTSSLPLFSVSELVPILTTTVFFDIISTSREVGSLMNKPLYHT